MYCGPLSREPLDGVRRRRHRLAEARPERLVHERADVGPSQRPGRGGPREDLPIVAVDREGDREHLAAPAGDQEDVRAPALVRRRLLHLAEMRPAVAAMDPRRQHQAVHAHEPPDALAVVASAEGAVDHRPHAAIAVGGAAVRDGADLLERPSRRRAAGRSPPAGRARRNTPSAAPSAASGRSRPPDAVSPSGPFAQPRTFFYDLLGRLQDLDLHLLLARAAARARESAGGLPAAALTGTTSSFVATAAVAPASKRRFHCRTTLGWMSSSRETSASVFSPFRSLLDDAAA